MPFYASDATTIALALLKALLAEEEVECDLFHFHLYIIQQYTGVLWYKLYTGVLLYIVRMLLYMLYTGMLWYMLYTGVLL